MPLERPERADLSVWNCYGAGAAEASGTPGKDEKRPEATWHMNCNDKLIEVN